MRTNLSRAKIALSPFLLVAMLVFVCCSHQQNSKDDWGISNEDASPSSEAPTADNSGSSETSEQAVAENNDSKESDAKPETKDAGDSSDLASSVDPKDAQVAEATEKKAEAPKADIAPEAEAKPVADNVSADPGVDPATMGLGEEAQKTTDTTQVANLPAADAVAPQVATTETAPVAPTLEGKGAMEVASNKPELLQSDTAVTETAPTETVAAASPAETKEEAAPATSSPKVKGETSRMPEVPKEAIERNGQKLNRYYFLRTGDSQAVVSQLVYGNSDKAKELSAWNPGKWTAGRTIFYASPKASDESMKSFYEENHVAADDYVVKSGDQLSTIARGKYGDARSWKEIAALNGIANPDHIKVGVKLALYPSKASEGSTGEDQTVAKADGVSKAEPDDVNENEEVWDEKTNGTVAQTTPEKTPVTAPQAPVAAKPTDAVAKPAVVATNRGPAEDKAALPAPAPIPLMDKAVVQTDKAKATEKPASLASMDVAKSVEGGSFSYFMGAAGVGLLFAFLMYRRAKRSRERIDYLE